VGFATQTLGREAARDWLHGAIPWWNPYSGIGLPLAGEMQPGAFSLPFVFLLLLPGGVLWLKIVMMILAGLATYALLRELGLGCLAALTGGLLFELNGTFAWMPGEEVIGGAIPFLPLLLYGIERARRSEGRAAGVFWVGISIAGAVYHGFPETAYINGLMAALWALYRFTTSERRWAFAGRLAYGGLLGLLLASPLLIAFWDCLSTSNTMAGHQLGTHYLPWAAFAMTFLPYVYGPIQTTLGNPNLATVWGRVGGYAGIILVFLAMAGISGRRERGLRWMLVFWIILAWAKSFGVQPVLGLMNHVPLLLETAFHRYAPPAWGLALVILAAYAVDDLRLEREKFPRAPAAAVLGFLALAIALAWPGRLYWGWQGHVPQAALRFLGISAAWALAGLALAFVMWSRLRGEGRRLALAGLLVMEGSAFFLIPTLCGVHPGRVDWPAIRFLQDHLGLSRFYTLGPIQPNYGAYFQIASINYNYLPIAAEWETYVNENLFPQMQKSRGCIFWPAWPNYQKGEGEECLQEHLAEYEGLGVRYVVASPGQALGPASPAPAAGPGSLPAGSGLAGPADAPSVPPDEKANDRKEMPLANAASPARSEADWAAVRKIYSDPIIEIWELPHPAPYYSLANGGPGAISSAARESVRVTCDAPATLIRRELFTPGWHATVNGEAVPVSPFERLFQAIQVPAGDSDVRFYFEPPHVGFGWIGCLLGFSGLAWEGVALLYGWRRSSMPAGHGR
jgi:hypothetical protein